MTFRLKEIRKEKGLTVQELADKSGVHPQTIIKLEEGLNNPDYAKLGTLVAICKVLKCKLSNLYPNVKEIG